MARLFVTGINLNKNELQNARIQNLSSNPSSPVAGQIYFNNVENEMRTYDGTQWVGSGSIKTGTFADRPQPSKQGLLYATTDTKVLYLDVVTGWLQVGVGTETTDILLNKTFGDKTYFGYDNTYASYIEGQVDSSGDLAIRGGNNLNLSTQNGDIILNADGASYIGSNAPGNRIVTVDELNSGDVIQSVTGTTGEVSASTDASGNVTLSLPNTVYVHDALNVGIDAENETYQNGTLNVWKTDGSRSLIADSAGLTVNGELELQNGSGNSKLNITYSGTGATRITSDDDIAIRSNNGDIILYPGNDTSWGGDGGTGKAYVHWGNDATGAGPENEITTAGNSQIITNKTVNDELGLGLESGSFISGNTGTAGDVVINAGQILELSSTNNDIVLNPDGQVVVNAAIDLNGNLKTPHIYGRHEDGGNLTLSDSNNISQIHIDSTSLNVELLPGSASGTTGKAFYGSSATAGNEIAKISDLQALSSGLNWKQAVNLLATTNINLMAQIDPPSSPPLAEDYTSLTIDGHSISFPNQIGYRVLLLGQDIASENGIYEIVNGSATGFFSFVRASDSNTNNELKGAAVFVMEGDQYGSTSWVQSNHYIGTPSDFAGQEWTQFSGQGTYTGSNSISLDGTQINAVVDNSRGLYVDGDGIYISSGLGIQFGAMSGAIEVNAGTGFTTESGTLEFASGYGVRKFTQKIGDGATSTIAVEHNLGTRHVTVQLYQVTSPYAQVEADVEHTDNNTVTLKFASTVALDEYQVVVVG